MSAPSKDPTTVPSSTPSRGPTIIPSLGPITHWMKTHIQSYSHYSHITLVNIPLELFKICYIKIPPGCHVGILPWILPTFQYEWCPIGWVAPIYVWTYWYIHRCTQFFKFWHCLYAFSVIICQLKRKLSVLHYNSEIFCRVVRSDWSTI